MSKQLPELDLVCASWQQAQQIVDSLLAQGLSQSAEIVASQAHHRYHVLVQTTKQPIVIKQALEKLPFKVKLASYASLVQ